MLAEFITKLRRNNFPLLYPDEVSPGLKPHAKGRLLGVYDIQRPAFDDQVLLQLPDSSSYLLSYFEFETYSKRLLDLSEDEHIRMTDMLWNFHHVRLTIEPSSCRFHRVAPEDEASPCVSLMD